MEFLTIFLSSLIALISPAGLIVDNTVADSLRREVKSVEDLRVRVDNRPNYQIIQGKAQRVRIATRGLKPIDEVRIAVLELESDPIDVDLKKIRGAKNWEAYRESLRQPIQLGIRLVFNEEDLNETLKSPIVQEQFKKILSKLAESSSARPNYELINPKIIFENDNRLRVQFRLVRIKASGEKAPPLDVDIDTQVKLKEGKAVELVEPKGTINGKTISRRLLLGFAEGISNQLNLEKLEEYGIIALFWRLEIKSGEIDLAAFVRVDRKN